MTYDVSSLRDAFDAFGLKVPWHHRQERDVRTLVGLWRDLHDGGETQPEQRHRHAADKHHALQDALHQVEYCCQMYQTLKSASDALARSVELSR